MHRSRQLFMRHRLSIILCLFMLTTILVLLASPVLKVVLVRQAEVVYPKDLFAIVRLANLQTTGISGKKRAFLGRMLPAVIQAQLEIQNERRQLLALEELKERNAPLSIKERKWLIELGRKMRRPVPEDGPDTTWFATMKRRVDIVPLSLALAQSAEESGWGTSRFAREGNAYFGQWTYDPSGMVPKEQRESKGDHRIARFKSPARSVAAYMRNLNTHPAYKEFRALRAQQRAEGKPLQGLELLPALSSYSERGRHYIRSVRSIIRYNSLHPLDWIEQPLDPREIAVLFEVPIG